MNIKKEYEENGYIITEYENGDLIKVLKAYTPSNVELEKFEEYIPEKEIKDYKMEIDMEYIKCLLEIQGGL